ncbi:hypothetical protein [Synechococcus sp. MVIR-18-1]|uniref:hypothetical protein n=1 Tax=Synechococcus sp. MVIR-18-1 TaxID=1386941 RepID=UPI001645C479|nr:hypothetical protein [Synechococcus sp. MVIR-18-1]QNI75627.1 hypothetical protein SynMVIR181_00627 [Synechococcus sp. MVIR-18-1]
MSNQIEFINDEEKETFEMMRTFLKDNIEREMKWGNTKEEATEHSLEMLNGLFGEMELTDEAVNQLLGDSQ